MGICSHQRHGEMTANLSADQCNDQNLCDPKRPSKKRRVIVVVMVMMATKMAAAEVAMISTVVPVWMAFMAERTPIIVTVLIDGEIVAHTDTVFTHVVILSRFVDE
jgi:hypothetical protein